MSWGYSNDTSDAVTTVSSFNTSGRFYLYANNRYASWGDVSYGVNYYQWNDTTSNGAVNLPKFRWNQQGLLVPPMTRVKRVTILGYVNRNAGIDDVELAVALLKLPNDPSGVIQSSTVTQQNLLVGQSWKNGSATSLATRKLIKIEIPDHEPSDTWSNLIIAARGVGNDATRYFYSNIRVEYTTEV